MIRTSLDSFRTSHAFPLLAAKLQRISLSRCYMPVPLYVCSLRTAGMALQPPGFAAVGIPRSFLFVGLLTHLSLSHWGT
jgi:hypothetical protein